MTPSETIFRSILVLERLPLPESEYRFHPTRQWRFDYAWPDKMVALEVEGGAWTRGRHTRGSGYLKDMEKYNEATVLGWALLRVTPKELSSGNTMRLLSLLLK